MIFARLRAFRKRQKADMIRLLVELLGAAGPLNLVRVIVRNNRCPLKGS